jgi:hypothetical protein
MILDIRTFFLVSACDIRAPSSSAPFSYTLHMASHPSKVNVYGDSCVESCPIVLFCFVFFKKQSLNFMNDSCIQFSYQTFVLTLPVILSISPRNADTSELFPEPTVPTTATREPCLKLRLMLCRITCSSAPHENVPFSIIRGFSEIKNNILLL